MISPVTPHDRPSDVDAEQGEVHIDGPDGVAIALTPDAAEETARRLVEASAQARTQRSTSPGEEDSAPA